MIYLSIILILIIALFLRMKNIKKETNDDVDKEEIYDPYFFTKDRKEKHLYDDISYIQNSFPNEDSILKEYNRLKSITKKDIGIHYKNIPDDKIQYIDISDLETKNENEVKKNIVHPFFIGEKYKSPVNVWDIPVLRNSLIKANNEKELKIALGNMIHEKLNIDFGFVSDYRGPLRKYLYLHQSIQTNFESEYGTPMFIEIFGEVVHVDGKDIIDPDIQNNGFHRTLEDELPGPIIIRIMQASWSNITYPGVNVPFYM